MIRQKLNHNWQMYGPEEPPRPAVVPGTVYTDLLRSGDMEDPFWKDNENSALALMEKDYTYETCFDGEKDLLASRRILLRFDGLDTIADIYLNEVHVGSAYNMHRIWEYDVTQILRERDNKLRVVLHSPLNYIREAFGKCRTLGSEDAMDGFVHIRKAHCMFGWDWGAHLPDAGIFRQVSLLGITDARLDSVYVRQEHTDGEVTLHFEVEAEQISAVTEQESLTYTVEITAPEGEVRTYTDSPAEIHISNPDLWWPNGYGS